MKYWVLRGQRSSEFGYRNAFESIRADERETWSSRFYARSIEPGDRLFVYEGSPAFAIWALAEVVARRAEHDFEIRYMTNALDPRVERDADDLRAVPELEGVSFLKAGPVSTLHPLTARQAAVLLRLVRKKSANAERIWTHNDLGGSGIDPARDLLDRCVYAIVHPDRLRDAVAGGTPIRERKRWATARALLGEARGAGRRLAIVLADARSIDEILYWACLDEVELGDNETRYRVRGVHRVEPGHAIQELRLVSSGEPIAAGFIRSYAICCTPEFLALDPVDWEGERADELFGIEGEALRRLITHRRRERDLREAKLDETLRVTGALRCEVIGCGFDFEQTYGELGRRFANVHHLEPLAEHGSRVNRLEDLAVVCANCHAMIHRDGQTRPLHDVRPRGKAG